MESLRNGAPDANRFDVVLIDEAQDFPAEWYQCALKAMKDSLNGELLIVGDANQGVYGRKSVSWKQLGYKHKGALGISRKIIAILAYSGSSSSFRRQNP